MNLGKWLREPLVHFLLAGGTLFVLASFWQGSAEDGRTIHIGREELLVHMQGRAQVYDEAAFAAMLDAMPAEQRRALVREAALQEALYREGQALDLAEADPLIRQRIVQQMRLLIMEDAAADLDVSDAEVEAYYRENSGDYRAPAQASFTHVFFSESERGPSASAARSELNLLRADHVPFEAAAQHGDRFLYQLNYIDADPELVASHFGTAFARRVFSAELGEWQGPFRSDYGWHLVLLRSRSPARSVPLAEIADRVREDALAAKRTRLAQTALDALLDRYRIETDPDLE